MAALASDWLRLFILLLWNRWTEFNESWQEARSQRPLPSLCFWADQKNKMATLASDWLRYFRLLLWNRWMEFNETWQEARSQCPLPSLCFSGRSEKQDGRPGLWLAETFSTSPLKPLNGIQWNLTGSKISMSSTKFVFFRLIGKTRLPPWPLIGWNILNFSSETAERNSMKLDKKQDLNVLYQVCVFRADQKTNMAALADSSKRWHIVLRCTICGPLGLLLTFYYDVTIAPQFDRPFDCDIIMKKSVTSAMSGLLWKGQLISKLPWATYMYLCSLNSSI